MRCISKDSANSCIPLVTGAAFFKGNATTTIQSVVPGVVCLNGDDNSTSFPGSNFCSPSDYYSSNETDKEDLGEDLSEGEIEVNTFFAKLENNYAEENIFAVDDLQYMI